MPVRQSSSVRLVLTEPRPLGPKSIGGATTPAVVQHDEYVPTFGNLPHHDAGQANSAVCLQNGCSGDPICAFVGRLPAVMVSVTGARRARRSLRPQHPARRGQAGPVVGGPQGPGPDLPHGTTIVAADLYRGVVMAGKRRSTAGNMIAQRDIEKVFRSDDYSCVGIGRVAGIGLELVRLFQLELAHYEKLEGRTLSLEGKANRLSAFVRGNMGAAMQGWWSCRCSPATTRTPARAGSSATTWPAGSTRSVPIPPSGPAQCSPGITEEALHRGSLRRERHAGLHARALRRRRRRFGDRRPDLARQIYPVAAMITADGFRRLSDAESGEYARPSWRNGPSRHPDRSPRSSRAGNVPSPSIRPAATRRVRVDTR